MPGVIKSGDLRFTVRAALIFEQHVIISLAVERGIEIDQIDTLTREIVAIAQNVEVITIK